MSKTDTLRSWIPYPAFELEVGDDGPIVRDLQVKRLNHVAGKTFNLEWGRHMEPPSSRQIFRQPDGDEQEKTTLDGPGKDHREVFVIDDDEIRQRRLREMSPEARAQFDAMALAEADASYDFLVGTVRQFVRVAPGQTPVLFEPADGDPVREIQSGEDLVAVLGGDWRRLRTLATAVWAENNLSGALKKGFRSRSASSTSSAEPGTAAPGQRPDGIAAPAAPEASVATEAATAPSATIPSGSIAS